MRRMRRYHSRLVACSSLLGPSSTRRMPVASNCVIRDSQTPNGLRYSSRATLACAGLEDGDAESRQNASRELTSARYLKLSIHTCEMCMNCMDGYLQNLADYTIS
jgi:hypothetical protein